MKTKALFLLVLLVPLLFLNSPSVRADLNTFGYNPIFWEDWGTGGTGSYSWVETNSTIILNGTLGAYEITRPLLVNEREDASTIEWFSRFNALTYGTWWNSSWAYRKLHTITGSSDGLQTNYQMRFIIHYGSGTDTGEHIYLNSLCQTDFDDIRFIKSDDTTEFDYWIQNETASDYAVFWVEIDSIAASPATTSVYVYYGSPSVSDNSNGLTTFLFFDDFNDNSFNTTKWTVQTGAGYDETGGNLEWWYSGARTLIDAETAAEQTFNVRYMVRAKHEDTTASSSAFLKLHEKGSATNFECTKLYWTTTANNFYARCSDDGASTGSALLTCSDMSSFSVYSLTWVSGSSKFYEEETLKHSETSNVPDEALVPAVWAPSAGAEVSYLDWCALGKFTTNEPTHTSTFTQLPRTEFKIMYAQTTSISHAITISQNNTAIALDYYSMDGTATAISYNYTDLGTTKTDYLRTTVELDALTRTFELTILNSSSEEIWDATYTTEVIPSRLEALNVSAEGGAWLEVVWIDAPFISIDSLREWQGVNTGTEWYENPYWMRQSTAADDEYFAVKCMPFQGYKTIVNWSMVGANGVHGGLRVRWYDRAGDALTGYVGIWWYRDAGVNFLDFIYKDSGASTHIVVTLVVAQEDAACFAVWIDQAEGKAYAYMQMSPHSSEFVDFWVIEITDIVDYDSWGAQILHEQVGCGVIGSQAQWQEVEIFHGLKTGITQPRFGGMWWEYNALFMIWFAVVTWIQQAFAIVLAPIMPFLIVVKSLLDNLPTILSNLVNIWGVISSVVVDAALEFINEFITPMVEVFFGYVVPNAMLGLWLAAGTILNGLLEAISTLLWGDATVLPAMFWQFAVFISTFIVLMRDGIVVLGTTFGLLTQLALGVPVTGIDLTGPIGWINAIIYYVISYAPVAIMFHMMFAIMQCVNQEDIMPLIDAGMLYLRVAEFMFNIIREVISMLIQGIQVVMDIIPF